MGLFMKITCESQGGLSPTAAYKNQRVLDLIIDALNDGDWQDSVCSQVTHLDPQFSHISLGTILRFFRQENIDAGNLRSLARYVSKDQKLIIDQMIAVDGYEDLDDEATRRTLVAEIQDHFTPVIRKYAARFEDFDAAAFLPLFAERMSQVADGEYVSTRQPRFPMPRPTGL